MLKRRPKGVEIGVLGHLWGPKGCQEGILNTKKGVLGRLEALLVVMRVQGAVLEFTKES